MPTFSAIAFERLIEPGGSRSTDGKSGELDRFPVPKPKSTANFETALNSSLERRNSTSTLERKSIRPLLTPALYATPAATPLPDSPSSYSPSPYVINHKRRGPRLASSSSETDLRSGAVESINNPALENEQLALISPKNNGNNTDAVQVNGFHEPLSDGAFENAEKKEEILDVSNDLIDGKSNNIDPLLLDSEKDGEDDDFYDPQESMSYASSSDVEDCVVDSASTAQKSRRVTEFYDAWDELSNESSQHHSQARDYEAEIAEMKVSMLMEYEKRKQAEDALTNMLLNWQKMRQQLALSGLRLPPFPEGGASEEEEHTQALCQQLHVARFVAHSIGRGTAKAEAEMELEAQLNAKNSEISRLLDRLHYYEAMNREMSHWNQEVIEEARRKRVVRKRRQRWMWGTIAAAITLGGATLAWTYLGGNGGADIEHDDDASREQ